MWLFLPTGFYSVVVHRDDPGRVIVRSREPEAIEHFRKRMALANAAVIDPQADYPYRVTVSRRAWAAFLALSARDMKATNFKSEAERVRGRDAYTGVLHEVWTVLWRAFAARRPS